MIVLFSVRSLPLFTNPVVVVPQKNTDTSIEDEYNGGQTSWRVNTSTGVNEMSLFVIVIILF